MATGIVGISGVVKDERVGSNRYVQCAGGIEQHCCRANCGIGRPVVQAQRSTTNTGAKAGVYIGKERPPTDCRISRAGVAKERILTDKRAEGGVVATLFTSRLCSW